MACSHRASGLFLAFVLAGCGESFERADGGAAGEDDGGAAGAGTAAGSPNAGDGGRASAGTSSSGGKGGAPVGGASMGGATGGVTTGGTSPGGGGAAGSTPTSGAECEVAEDCRLIDDCCSCSAEPKGVGIPACDAVCIQSACSARGVQGVSAKCVAKRCVLDLSCNALEVTCKAAQPACASGQVPSVVEGCWGPCIHATECREVADCMACGAGSSCVTQSLMLPSVHCVGVSAACEAAPSCECVDACSQQCSDEGGKIACFCLGC